MEAHDPTRHQFFRSDLPITTISVQVVAQYTHAQALYAATTAYRLRIREIAPNA